MNLLGPRKEGNNLNEKISQKNQNDSKDYSF